MSIAVLGEAIVDMIGQYDGQYQPSLGGSPYNVAVCAARQGARVSYLSPLSNDHFGDLFAYGLSAEKISHPVQRRSSCPSSLALVAMDDNNQPSYRLYRDGVADKDINADEILANMPRGVTIFHTGSLAITPDYLPTVSKVISALKQQQVLISIDVNMRDKACTAFAEYRAGVKSILPAADIIKASDEDLKFLEPNKNEQDYAKELASCMVNGLFVYTKGERGGVVIKQDLEIDFSAKKIGQFEDAIGAGDTFYATFLSYLLRNNHTGSLNKLTTSEISTALEFATIAAGINVTRAGCNPPTLDEILREMS